MTLLPIVERELLVAARRPWIHWLRVGAAGLVIGVWLLLLLAAGGHWNPQRLGQALFNGVSIPAFVFALFTGVFLTADCISSERREGTLGLLFLTDLRGYDIALGKLAAASLCAGSGLLAIVPMLAVPVLLGGVSGLTMVTRAVTLLLAALLSLTAGLLCSTLLGETRRALLATLALLMVLIGLPLLAGFLQDASGTGLLPIKLYRFSPVYLFGITEQAARVGSPFWVEFVQGCGWQFCLCLGFLVVASWRLPRLARSEKMVPGAAPAAPRPRPAAAGDLHPFWLAGHDQGTGRMLFSLLGLGWAAWLGLSLHALIRNDGDTFFLALIPAYGMHLLFKCQFAAEAARRFAEDRASGALEMLLSTPLSPRRILEQTRRALKRRFQAARWLVLSTNAGMVLIFLAGSGFNAPSSDLTLVVTLMLGAGGLLLVDCLALAWTAMVEGLRGRKPLRAALGAVARVLVPAWAGLFLYLFLGFSGLLDDWSTTKALLVLWFGGSAVLDLALASRARNLLAWNFRQLAAGEAVLAEGSAGDC